MAKTTFKLNITSRAELVAALDELFAAENGFEIPDEAIVGPFKAKFAMLDAKVSALINQVTRLNAAAEKPAKAKAPAVKAEEPEAPKGRVDAVALASKGKAAKK